MLLRDLALLCLCVISSASANCLYGIPLHETSDCGPAKTPWNYTNAGSPIVWATLDPNYKNCAVSKTQSPVNLDATIPLASNPIIKIPVLYNARMVNSGHGIYVYPPENLAIPPTVYNGQEYLFKQFHLHTPSEHRFDDEYYVLELHMVHQNISKRISEQLSLNKI